MSNVRPTPWGLSALFAVTLASAANAQSAAPQPPAPNSLNTGSSTGTLSDKLERSDGVITPRANVDPGIKTTPPVTNPGTMPVIPPPGSPGGNPNVQPK